MDKRPSPPAGQSPRQNLLLAALPAADYERLLPHLEPVSLELGRALYESGSHQGYVFFPTNSIVSLLYVMEDGSSAEIAVVGNEGLVGIALFMGGESTPSRAVVQSAGHGYRLRGSVLKSEFGQGGDLQHLLLRYTQALITQMAQTAVCNRHHSLEQQLCRWLLLSLDRLASNELTMTQELIANMLGVRREGVTEAAGHLAGEGIDPLQPRQDRGAGPSEAGSARVRVLFGGETRIRPLASAHRRDRLGSRASPARRRQGADAKRPADATLPAFVFMPKVLRDRHCPCLTRPLLAEASGRHYFVPETSTTTRRSGCRQAISALVTFLPLQSPGFVTGSDPSVPLAAILPAGIPADSTR